jgi:hypothetical protein
MRGRNRPYRLKYLSFTLVGAEGFEVSFSSGHYAVFFVEIKGKPSQNQRFPNFSGVPFFPYSLTNGRHSARIWYHWYHPPLRLQSTAN